MAKDKGKKRQEIQQRRATKSRERKRAEAKQRADAQQAAANRKAQTPGAGQAMNVYDAPFGQVVTSQDPTKMQRENFGGTQIYRPGVKAEVEVRTEAEAALRAKHGPGLHTDGKVINGIIKDHLQYFHSQLDAIAPKLASLHLMEFILREYNLSSEIDGNAKQKKLGGKTLRRWLKLAPDYRRALKYLAERTVMLEPPKAPQIAPHEGLGLLDRLLASTEQLVAFASLSDQTHMLFPEDTTLIISEPGELDYINLRITKPIEDEIRERNMEDVRVREPFVPVMRPIFDEALRKDCLDEGFRQVFGLSYEECKAIIKGTIDSVDSVNSHKGFQIPFIKKEVIVKEQSARSGVPPENIERLLSGFTLSSEKMRAEGRVIWKPKQEYRAYRRGLFEFPHPSGSHFIWSKGMAKEAFTFLDRDLAFQHVPPEWEEKPIRDGVNQLSNRCGVEFEKICQGLLKQRGFEIATNFKDGIGVKPNRLVIPPDVGELDCLAYSPSLQLLIILEFKLVQTGTEPARFRDDLKQFAEEKKGFFAKHKRKRQWVLEHLTDVKRALATVPGAPSVIDPQLLGAAIITFFPSFASYFDEDALCLSVGEFFGGWDKSGKWPSERALFKVGG